MKVAVLTELSSTKGIIPAGRIIEITPELLVMLKGKLSPAGYGVFTLSDYATGRTDSTTKRPCRYENHTDHWESIYGLTLCRICNPPAPGADRKSSNTPVLPAIGE